MSGLPAGVRSREKRLEFHIGVVEAGKEAGRTDDTSIDVLSLGETFDSRTIILGSFRHGGECLLADPVILLDGLDRP